MAERVAEWRIEPRAERALVAEMRRWQGRRRTFQAFVLGVVVAAPLVGLGVLSERLSAKALGPLVVGLAALGLLALVRSARAVGASRVYQGSLREEHGAVGGCLVEMAVRQGEATTGLDHGVVWADDGRLFFSGARTSFGLSLSDVLLGTRVPLADEDEHELIELPLRVETSAGGVTLRLRPLDRRDASVAALAWTIRSWLSQAQGGGGQLPPLALAPGAPGRSYLLARALGVTLLWLVGLPLAVVLSVTSLVGCYTAPVVIPLTVAAARLGLREFGTPFEPWQAWADRRRLEREAG